jgi:hypothetical protein
MMSHHARWVTALAVSAVAVGAVGCGGGVSGASNQPTASNTPAPTKLNATVEANGQVSLTTPTGGAVTHLHNGLYTIMVTVNSTTADFHLTGPSVQRTTRAHVASVAIWGIQFLKGTYHYLNDQNPRASTHTISVY